MNLDKIVVNSTTVIKKSASIQELEKLRVKYLGRSGEITEVLKQIGKLPANQRASLGKQANQAKQQIELVIKARQGELEQDQITKELGETKIDLSAPTPSQRFGHTHPINNLLSDIVRLFWQMGFEVVQGPEIETQWYNFEALNLPADHPARDMQDTFYLEDDNLPRTHTSGMQIRHMEANQPPIRIISPGKVYRNEDEDSRHIWSFVQVEGLVVDEGIGVADLKGTLLAMVQGVLGKDTEIRLRPNYFPYTEPSIEVDASCVICHGKGCATCSGTGWIELLGSGLVHPQVLENVGIDSKRYSGFAFGVGLERLAAVKYQVPDLREFWRPNLRFLEQF
ncbi:MAG TPA: phenylalanine--tRNA ligase subunit alpha [Candidatus Saccharimonadales bacterium]|nr:phenylalanine--tRNA ligase subunit alpha [Candidatus Saccharimonadales bacterium]